MKKKTRFFALPVMLIVLLACAIPSGAPATQPAVVNTPLILPVAVATSTSQPAIETPAATLATDIVSTSAVVHSLTPSISAKAGTLIFDVDSSVTAAEKRAPYGDSYDINRLERPFLQDMTYVPDLDITTFSLSQDANFYYVSFSLKGSDPNNAMGINYGVELDTNADGFGDFVIWARGPYIQEWSTDNVQVYADKNHDTSGLSADKSDAPVITDGYETLIFDGGRGAGDDPDLAWARINAGSEETLQFAFKKSMPGSLWFMFSAIADAGLKSVGKLDYVDRFSEPEAGSPVKGKKYFPLGALFAVDNTCRQPYGFKPTGYEPMICPAEIPPTKKPGGGAPGPTIVPTVTPIPPPK